MAGEFVDELAQLWEEEGLFARNMDGQLIRVEKATEDANIIHEKGQGRWGTDERGIFKIIGVSPKEHLQNVSKYVDSNMIHYIYAVLLLAWFTNCFLVVFTF